MHTRTRPAGGCAVCAQTRSGIGSRGAFAGRAAHVARRHAHPRHRDRTVSLYEARVNAASALVRVNADLCIRYGRRIVRAPTAVVRSSRSAPRCTLLPKVPLPSEKASARVALFSDFSAYSFLWPLHLGCHGIDRACVCRDGLRSGQAPAFGCDRRRRGGAERDAQGGHSLCRSPPPAGDGVASALRCNKRQVACNLQPTACIMPPQHPTREMRCAIPVAPGSGG